MLLCWRAKPEHDAAGVVGGVVRRGGVPPSEVRTFFVTCDAQMVSRDLKIWQLMQNNQSLYQQYINLHVLFFLIIVKKIENYDLFS